MARQVFEDFLHSMRFHVIAEQIGDFTPLQVEGYPDAGFSAVSTPELTVEAVEYKEGSMVYTQKYPGNPSVSDITLSRGVARRDSSFWSWMRVVAEGTGNYRADLRIKHFHRQESLIRDGSPGAIQQPEVNYTEFSPTLPAREYLCRECFPIRHKVAADLDATSSEISIMELDVSMEHFEVVENLEPPSRGQEQV